MSFIEYLDFQAASSGAAEIMAATLTFTSGTLNPPVLAVSYVTGTNPVYGFQTDALTAQTPTGIQNGDTLLAAVFARQDLNTPSGWTKVIETAGFQFFDATWSQRVAVFSKNTVLSTDSSTNVTFTTTATSHRMGIIYIVLRDAVSLAASSSTAASFVDTWSTTPPALTANTDGQMLVVIGSTIVDTNTEPLETTPTVPTSFTRTTAAGIIAYRLTGAYRAVSNGQSNSGDIVFVPGSIPSDQGFTNNGLGSITLRYSPT